MCTVVHAEHNALHSRRLHDSQNDQLPPCTFILGVFVFFQAFSPYKLALVPREGHEHRRESSAAPPARLTIALLALDPGQAVAAQGQLAVALEDTGSCTLRQPGDGENIDGDQVSGALQREIRFDGVSCCKNREGTLVGTAYVCVS